MGRTSPTPTTRLTANYGTSSGTPEEDSQNLADVAQLDAEIPRGNARPTASLLQPKPKPRSPIGLEVGKSAGGGLGVVVAIPLGAGPISARGGINLGAGGAIKGGSIGLGFGLGPIGGSIDVGTDQDEEGRGGCYQYVTVKAGPFSHTYGRNVCEPKPPKSPGESILTPTPAPYPGPVSCSATPAPANLRSWENCYPSGSYVNTIVVKQVNGIEYLDTYYHERDRKRIHGEETTWCYTYVPHPLGGRRIGTRIGTKTVTKWSNEVPNGVNTVETFPPVTVPANVGSMSIEQFLGESGILPKPAGEPPPYDTSTHTYSAHGWGGYELAIIFGPSDCPTQKPFPTPHPTATPPPTPLSPPVPNPPPRKKMDDACCKKSLILQAEILRLLGRELGPQGLVPQTKKVGFIGEEIERIETPILDPEKPKKIKVRFETVYDLLKYALKQANNLDTALDPQSYKAPTGKVQNPAYNRDSEQSLKSNNQPNRDKSGNKRELEINKDDEVKMGGFLQQQQYVFDALRRLEYLFPSGELSDALIAKSLLIPGAKDDIKIHNMIMAYEVQMQYLDAALGNPREKLVIKDANPAIEGDQPIEVTSLSISDLLRQNIKFHIDTGGDVDALVNLMLRDFRTNLANRIDLIKSAEMVQALFEDSGMLEKQEYIDIHLEGDVYAGQWVKGQGFKANPNLEKKTEEATEEVLRATMKPVDQKIKVSRRSKDEKTDMRDLLRGLADFIQRLVSIPSAGDAGKVIDKLVESAKFKVQTDMALFRQNVTQAAAASRNRTRKRKK